MTITPGSVIIQEDTVPDRPILVEGTGRVEVNVVDSDGERHVFSWSGPIDTITQDRPPVEIQDWSQPLVHKFQPGPFLTVALRFDADKVERDEWRRC